MQEDNNVATVRAAYDAFQRGDIDAILAVMDDSISWTLPGSPAVPLSGIRRGHQQVREFFSGLADRMRFNLFEPREYIAQGNRVVVLVRYEGYDMQTRRNFAADSCMVWTLSGGRITRFQEYTDTEALAAAAQPSDTAAGAD